MNKRNLQESMNELYATCENAWGSRVDPAIVERAEILKTGNVLDLGAGDGRQALFLAEKGFSVTAVDFANNGLKILDERARATNLEERVTTIHSDISEFGSTERFDNVISTFVLHFLKKEDAAKVIRNAADMTEQGGVHVLIDFTMPKRPRDLWLHVEAIEALYREMGWEIIENSETIRRMSQDPETEMPTYVFVAKKQ